MRKSILICILVLLCITGCATESIFNSDNNEYSSTEIEEDVTPEVLLDDYFSKKEIIHYELAYASVSQKVDDKWQYEELPEKIKFVTENQYEATVSASKDVIYVDGFHNGRYYLNELDIEMEGYCDEYYITKEDGIGIKYEFDGIYEEWFVSDWYEKYQNESEMSIGETLYLSSEMFEGLSIEETTDKYVVKGEVKDYRAYLHLRYSEYGNDFCLDYGQYKVNAELLFNKEGDLLEYKLNVYDKYENGDLYGEEVEQYYEAVYIYTFSNYQDGDLSIPQRVIDDALDGSEY